MEEGDGGDPLLVLVAGAGGALRCSVGAAFPCFCLGGRSVGGCCDGCTARTSERGCADIVRKLGGRAQSDRRLVCDCGRLLGPHGDLRVSGDRFRMAEGWLN